MPVLPAWVDAGFTWAPDVRRIDDRYVMWFTARLKGYDPPTQCIGVAVSDDPFGPFVGEPEPRICQLERRGSIDARSYEAPDGQLWLHWKSDDNADVDGTTKASIYAARLAPDGIELDSEWTEILTADQPWEGRIVEAPQLVAGGGRLWLFYSANWFNQPAYGIGVAECETPAGPCTKPLDRAWLGSNAQGFGPGEASLFTDDDGRMWIVYAPWAVQFETKTPRPVALAHVAFDDNIPYLARP
jgi:GH43 family beta-xylosidase